SQLAMISGAVCAGVFGFGLLRGYGLLPMLKSSVSLAVAAVPEGLPTVATTTLALGIREMSRHHVAIRKLAAVETLGSVQTFCMDKTGTLTENRMRVVSVVDGLTRRKVEKGNFEGLEEGLRSARLDRLLEVIALCNDTDINGSGGPIEMNGSPTESALIELALLQGIDVQGLRHECPRIDVHYRAERRPWMTTIHDLAEGGRMVAVKGSPAEVLAMCEHIHLDDGISVLDDDTRAQLIGHNETMAGEALRVLGVAYAVRPPGAETSTALTWLGMVGMTDPLREGMPELIQRFHGAGIDTVMITGDQSATAYAIGRELGLANGGPMQILDASSLEKVDENLLAALVKNVHVFARVSPKHKLRIVQALQRGGRVVAMTGDGINDGPALKAADIGVAMGAAGTDVARSMADVVLEDDNLHTMTTAISQGRTIYANIRKSVHFLLATNFSEIELMVAGIALGLGQPLTPIQLLWINLATDIFPALTLAMERAEPDVMNRPPRDPGLPIIHRRDLANITLESAMITAGTLGSFLIALRSLGPLPAGTVAFTSLTLAQLLHATSCRSERHGLFSRGRLPRNPWLDAALGLSALTQLALPYLPPTRALLGLVPLGPGGLALSLAGATAPLLVNEAIKELRVRQAARNDHPPMESPS
ncbi:MAG TPA: cation-transporting P-type ATPase, partial [Chromatiales bacterium]|nr:cation-transporting P-type ATPase [Chromatiales bacterium]